MGRTEIPGGDIYYNHFTYTTALISQASLFEAHERYLDLHIVLSGCEQVALAPVESLDEAEVRADEDSTMYLGTPEYSVTLDQNRFLLVFPGEGHLPKLSDRVPMNIDKLVLKIPC
jgi:YhcH/YjgK/YiaL family protein